jgi:lipopolysaccharide transport system ATP-binding protein
MAPDVISVESISKTYQLGTIGTGTFYGDLKRWWAAKRGLPDPYAKIGGHEHGGHAGESLYALEDISFTIGQGDAVGIIGRNGAGKSTLLKIMSRVTAPTSGQVNIKGRLASLLEVGTGFHPELTGEENIYLNGAIMGMGRAEIRRKFDEIVSFSGVEQFIDTPVKRYSSGMYVRLAFAVAAHLDPEILIVDEVLAVGDAQFQKKCLGKMQEVGKEGRTVLFVSHNTNAIEQLCTRGLILEKGRLKLYSDDVRDVIRQYLSDVDDECCEGQWVNSGEKYDNPWFKPLRFFLGNADGSALEQPARNDSDLFVFVEAEIRETEPSLVVGYALYNETGIPVYWTYQSDTPEEQWPKLSPGRCLLRSRIPRRFLNEGAYRVELIGGLHPRQWLFEPGKGTPMLSLQIQGGLSDSPHFLWKRPGVVAPIVPWERVD